jgi:hypothetical protein
MAELFYTAGSMAAKQRKAEQRFRTGNRINPILRWHKAVEVFKRCSTLKVTASSIMTFTTSL